MIAALFTFTALAFSPLQGTCLERQKLTASDEGTSKLFGYAVAMEGDTLVLGAPYDSDGGFQAGAAYVFVHAATVPLAGGAVLLVGGPRLFRLAGASPPQWALALPDDCALIGLGFSLQAAHVLGGLPYALSNARDVTVGL